MTAFDLAYARTRFRRMLLACVLAAPLLLAGGCSSSAQACSGGLHQYKDKCLTNMAIQYVGCTEDRGVSTSNEISAGVSGTLKLVTDAAVNVASKSSKVENTPVALQIVHDCMEIAKSNSPPDDPEQAVAANYLKQWQKQVIDQTPTLTISPATAKVGDKVTVKGSKFWATEMVEIRLGATLLEQVKADDNGRFSVVITVPPDAPPPDFGSHIVGTGESSAASADAPFRTKP